MSESEKFVFISHSNESEKDLPFSKRLYQFLTQKKHICAWMDRPDMRAGDWRKQIYEKILTASAYILVASWNSLTSDEVQKEINNMISNKDKTLIPICIDEAYTTPSLKKGSAGYNFGNGNLQAIFLKNYLTEEEAFEELLFKLPRDLTKLQNNPCDFVRLQGNEEYLAKYKGKDSYVEIPTFMRFVGKEAFIGNGSLEKVIIPPSVREIGIRAFCNCSKLSCVEGMENVVEVYPDAFCGTKFFDEKVDFNILNGVLLRGKCDIKKLVLPEIRVIANSAFDCCDAEDIVLPDTLEAIGQKAFSDSCYIKEIRIPKSVNYIGKGAFSGCIKLKRVIFEGKIPEKAKEAFGKNVFLEEE